MKASSIAEVMTDSIRGRFITRRKQNERTNYVCGIQSDLLLSEEATMPTAILQTLSLIHPTFDTRHSLFRFSDAL